MVSPVPPPDRALIKRFQTGTRRERLDRECRARGPDPHANSVRHTASRHARALEPTARNRSRQKKGPKGRRRTAGELRWTEQQGVALSIIYKVMQKVAPER